MSDFMKLFEDETKGTIEALVGVAPSLELKEEQELSIISNIVPPIVLVKIKVSGDVDADAMVALPPSLAAGLSDMMMGEEPSERDDVNDDDMDAAKEIVSNIFGAISNSLSAQKELPVLSFSIESIELIKDDDDNLIPVTEINDTHPANLAFIIRENIVRIINQYFLNQIEFYT